MDSSEPQRSLPQAPPKAKEIYKPSSADVPEGLRESGHIQSQTGDEIGAGGSQISNPRKNIKSLVSKSKKVDRQSKLPQKYELCECFFYFLHSIWLLRNKGCMTTFTSISNTFESLTERRFCHGHLAQLKFILPEAIELSKILVLDEKTNCMMPDLHVMLNADAIEYEDEANSQLGYRYLRKEFRSRLLAFYKAHPEDEGYDWCDSKGFITNMTKGPL